jgi:hypothetical protein
MTSLGMPRLVATTIATSLGVILESFLVFRVDELLALHAIPKFVERKDSEQVIREYLESKVLRIEAVGILMMIAGPVLLFALSLYYVPWAPASIIGHIIRLILFGFVSFFLGALIFVALTAFFYPDQDRIAKALNSTGYSPCLAIAKSWKKEKFVERMAASDAILKREGIRQLVLCAEPECSSEEQEALIEEAVQHFNKRDKRYSEILAITFGYRPIADASKSNVHFWLQVVSGRTAA